MKKHLLFLVFFVSTLLGNAQSALEIKFINAQAKPFTWWHWMNNNISEQGIVKDLEAMKDVGLGGFHLFSAAPIGTARGKVAYFSDEWWNAIDLTAKTAERLGLDFTFHNCAGFATTAGPWITPEYAMKQLVWTSKRVSGKSSIKLEKFTVEKNKEVPLITTINGSQPEQHPKKVEWQNKYYKDVAVLVFPTPQSDVNDKPERLADWDLKANFGIKDKIWYINNRTWDNRTVKFPIKLSEILDITEKMLPDGTLNWTPPDNRDWTILRFGYTITGMQNHPAPVGGRGLECDKYSKAAINFHFQKGVQPIIDKANAGGRKRLTTLLIDSFESHDQNWTDLMPKEFKLRRKYDITKYLVALTGRIIESRNFTERFLADFRKTCAEMASENHYAEFAKLCHKNGLKFTTEGYGHPSPLDSLQVSMTADLPMGEFSAFRKASIDLSTKIAQSAAEYTNKKIVGVESFTASANDDSFELTPAKLKWQHDTYFAQGMNRVIFHTFAHQPFRNELKPAMSMWKWGGQFHRNNTLWNDSKAWLKYFSRIQSVLQEGTVVSDVSIFYGEDVPDGLRVKYDPNNFLAPRNYIPWDERFEKVGNGYDYLFANADILADFEFTNDKIIHKKSGVNFSLLVMPKLERISPSLLSTIARMVKCGANVVMDKPIYSLTLTDYPKCDKQVADLASVMWANIDSNGIAQYGKGKIFPCGYGVDKALEYIGIKKDFEAKLKSSKDVALKFIHKKVSDLDVYFVVNTGEKIALGDFIFRVSGKIPSIWNPVNGNITRSVVCNETDDGRTCLTMGLKVGEAKFIVFENDNPKSVRIVKASPELEGFESSDFAMKTEANGNFKVELSNGHKIEIKSKLPFSTIDISQDWKLSFPKERGGRQNISLEKLKSWDLFENFDEKYFSGTAMYSKEFDVPENWNSKNSGLILSLGDVATIAKVYLNGLEVDVLWHAPYSVDISKFAKVGKNKLQIMVTNTFTNRIIGDQHYPDNCPDRNTRLPDWVFTSKLPIPPTQRKTFYTYSFINKDKSTVKSGLLGPVKIIPYNIFKINCK